LFQDCTAITEIQDNPMPLLTGAPASSMFLLTCYNMSGVTGALPSGFLDTRGLTGAPAVFMFYLACYNMSKVTSLPAGFLDMSGLTGTPATDMFRDACRGMSGVTNAYIFNISSNVTFDAVNVGTAGNSGPLASSWRGMTQWPGTVMWGTNVLFEAFAPSNRIYTINGSTNVPGYADFDANWK